MNYLDIKHLHITFAALSGALFLVRGLWMLRDSPLTQKRSINLASYVIDTVLLASALTLVVWSAQYPFIQPWLTAKVLFVLAYIVAGAVALRRGKTKAIRIGALVIALLLFATIVKIAVTKQPL